jgi:hypothetical protein
MAEADKSEKVVIKDMYMVYWIDSYDVEADILYDTALPAWRIEYGNGKVKFISATTQ